MVSKTALFILNLAASILVAVGAITISTSINNPVVGIALVVLGAVGFGIREGIKEYN